MGAGSGIATEVEVKGSECGPVAVLLLVQILHIAVVVDEGVVGVHIEAQVTSLHRECHAVGDAELDTGTEGVVELLVLDLSLLDDSVLVLYLEGIVVEDLDTGTCGEVGGDGSVAEEIDLSLTTYAGDGHVHTVQLLQGVLVERIPVLVLEGVLEIDGLLVIGADLEEGTEAEAYSGSDEGRVLERDVGVPPVVRSVWRYHNANVANLCRGVAACEGAGHKTRQGEYQFL